MDYVNLYSDNLISKEELAEYKVLTDQNLKELDLSSNQLNEKLEEFVDQNYSLDLGNKLNEFLSLKELKPQVLIHLSVK